MPQNYQISKCLFIEIVCAKYLVCIGSNKDTVLRDHWFHILDVNSHLKQNGTSFWRADQDRTEGPKKAHCKG